MNKFYFYVECRTGLGDTMIGIRKYFGVMLGKDGREVREVLQEKLGNRIVRCEIVGIKSDLFQMTEIEG